MLSSVIFYNNIYTSSMKNLILFIVVAVLLLVACSNNPRSTSQSDSNTLTAKSKTTQNLDSINYVKDSLSIYAWDNLKFGVSKQEVMANPSFGGEKESVEQNGRDSYFMPLEKQEAFASKYALSELSFIRANFKNNKLCWISIESYEVDSLGFSSLENDCDNIINQCSVKYGEPSQRKTDSIVPSNVDEKGVTLATFDIGHKTIVISLKKAENKYKYSVFIWNSDFDL